MKLFSKNSCSVWVALSTLANLYAPTSHAALQLRVRPDAMGPRTEEWLDGMAAGDIRAKLRITNRLRATEAGLTSPRSVQDSEIAKALGDETPVAGVNVFKIERVEDVARAYGKVPKAASSPVIFEMNGDLTDTSPEQVATLRELAALMSPRARLVAAIPLNRWTDAAEALGAYRAREFRELLFQPFAALGWKLGREAKIEFEPGAGADSGLVRGDLVIDSPVLVHYGEGKSLSLVPGQRIKIFETRPIQRAALERDLRGAMRPMGLEIESIKLSLTENAAIIRAAAR